MLTKIGHYRIEEKLSAGGMAEVYRARDERLERDVVLKFLHQRLLTEPRAAARFVREARAASALNHPNIITIYDAGDSEAGRFIVMEFVRGRTLRALKSEETSLETLIGIASQIAKALAAAHAAGIVHRDIKPENIMVRDDGYVKVLDFGLARWETKEPNREPDTKTAVGSVLGTLRYMSPEQASGDAAVLASDIFSFGLVLYELFTGKYPFDARNEIGILRAISLQSAVPPSRVKPQISAPLENLILGMLEKEPHRRPAAAEVVRTLEAITGHRGAGTPIVSRTRRRVVGRQSELAELRSAFESTMRGRGLLVTVSGEAGIGKTTLVEDFFDGLSGENCGIGRGRSSERLAGTEAYLPLLEALEELIHAGKTGWTLQLMKQTAPNWYMQVAPESTQESTTAVSGQFKSASQERLKRELAAFLEQASRPGPLLLFLDDLHWADESTVDMLAYVATRFDSMRVLVIATYRPEELALYNRRFSQVKLDLQARGHCQDIALNFLTREDIEAYISLEFPRLDFPQTFSELIHEKTEGSPFFMVAVLRYLRDRKIITQDQRGWSLSETLPDIESKLPQSIQGMIDRKIELLTDANRKLLNAASVQGYEFDSAVIAKVLPMDPVDVEEGLDVLDRVHGFVRLVREQVFPDRTVSLRYRFVHVLYHNAFYGSLGPARKTSWSASVAQTLLSLYGSHASELASQLAVLFETARDFSQSANYFSVAAQNAAKVFAYNEAALLSRRGLKALEMMPYDGERLERELTIQLQLGVSLLATQGYGNPEVQRIYNHARQLCIELGENPRLFPALWGLQTSYVARLDLPPAREIGDQLLRLAQKSDNPELLLGAHLGAGAAKFLSGEFESALEHFRQYRVLDKPENRVSTTRRYGLEPGILLRGFEARVLWFLGFPDQCLTGVYESLKLARSLSHPPTLAFVLAFAALTHQMRGEVAQTQKMAEELIELGTQQGMPLWIAEGSFFAGWVCAEQARADEGISLMRRSLAGYCATGTEMARPYFHAVLAETLGKTQRAEEGIEVLNNVVNFPYPMYYRSDLFRIHGDLLLAGMPTGSSKRPTGATEAAESHLLQALHLAREEKAKSFELRAAISLSQLWHMQHKTSEAQEILLEAYQWFSEGFETVDLRKAKVQLDRL